MSVTSELHEVITTEAQLTENLVGVLRQQQQAIIHNSAEDLSALLQRGEELLQPIQALEKERTRLAALTMGGTTNGSAKSTSWNDLLTHLGEEEASVIGSGIRRLKAASEEVLRINRMNKPLLEHSQYFIKQTLKAITDDYKKNLIDKRM